ncbi:MAG TPA: hydroxymethylglutaryl-CoA lyase [Bacillota bacterium]
MALPKRVRIYEVGPREGFQFEKGPISTDDKVALVDALSETGLGSIEVTSFVSPKWVPQMADAEEVLARIRRKPGVEYRALFLNLKGLERALKANVTIDGEIILAASDKFLRTNNNRSIDDALAAIPEWIAAYERAGIPVNQLDLMTTFGCNYEGHISLERVLDVLGRAAAILEQHGHKVERIKLADTMGWANPAQVKRTIYALRERWPDARLCLHLHDTRGTGLANAFAALEEGVTEFESAVGGLGGCPFASMKGAAGNIATEDFAFMCEEMGVETGIDLEAIAEAARLAERIVGHDLPGKLAKGGLMRDVRPGTWAAQVAG